MAGLPDISAEHGLVDNTVDDTIFDLARELDPQTKDFAPRREWRPEVLVGTEDVEEQLKLLRDVPRGFPATQRRLTHLWREFVEAHASQPALHNFGVTRGERHGATFAGK